MLYSLTFLKSDRTTGLRWGHAIDIPTSVFDKSGRRPYDVDSRKLYSLADGTWKNTKPSWHLLFYIINTLSRGLKFPRWLLLQHLENHNLFRPLLQHQCRTKRTSIRTSAPSKKTRRRWRIKVSSNYFARLRKRKRRWALKRKPRSAHGLVS